MAGKKTVEFPETYTESIFMDSGAHSLYNIHVLKHGKREGRHGRELSKPIVRWGDGDFSYYDLSKGSPFRKYCDRYASFIRKMEGKVDFFATVDAISNPDLTWEIQRFFEEEHGVQPVPIVHCHTPMKYVDRYVESGKYDLLGVGGLGQGISRHEYFRWGDEFFTHICPESNGYLPVIKTHGFAMTSWELICRWPWWSVDSATWVKLSAYGWLYIPRWSDTKGWRFDRAPMNINVSSISPQKKNKMKHFDNVGEELQETILRWIDSCGLKYGKADEEGNVVEFGVSVHHRARSISNLHYLKRLEASRPTWPHPLNPDIVEAHSVRYRKGFGLI